jgi:hypothetical protein
MNEKGCVSERRAEVKECISEEGKGEGKERRKRRPSGWRRREKRVRRK